MSRFAPLQRNVSFIHACDTKFQGLNRPEEKKNASPHTTSIVRYNLHKRTKSVHTNGDCRKIIIVISFF